jgi:hypothetical protein
MTAWQDQPPQSRRQLRLSEHRNDAHADGADGGLSEEQRVDVRVQDHNSDAAQTPTPHIESFARPDWDAPARRSAAHEGQAQSNQQPPNQQPRSRAEASGRRAQHEVPQAGPAGTDTTGASEHNTQTQDAAVPLRPSQVPSYGGPSFGAGAAAPVPITGTDGLRPRRGEDRSGEGESPRVAEPSPAYRVRDFSPESRRSAFSSTSELSASDWNRPGAAGEPTNLDYQTQQRPNPQFSANETPHDEPQLLPSAIPLLAVPQPVVPGFEGSVLGAQLNSAPSSAAANSLSDMRAVENEAHQPHPELTLTRRQLRVLRQAAEPLIEGSTDAPTDETHADQTHADQTHADETHPDASAIPDPFGMVSNRQTEVQQADAALPEVSFPSMGPAQAPPPLQAPAVPSPQSSRELSQAMAEFDSLMSNGPSDSATSVGHTFQDLHDTDLHDTDLQDLPADAQGFSASAQGQEGVSAFHQVSKPYTVPTGHWSTQGAIDDDDTHKSHEGTLGHAGFTPGAAVTTSHLVISSVPTVSDLLLPFTPTGEIMITGTIDLPSSLGSTGAHPARYDHSDVDTLLEASDREDSNADSAPVRAVRAVSTHTSSRGLIGSAKPPRNSRLPMILAISTAAVAAVVVVLFVAGLMLHMI